jgi:Cu2+-exporting ATPase
MTDSVCKHCGLPSQADFCCAGCEAAHAVILGMGLGEFYQRRQKELAPAAASPIRDPFATELALERFVRSAGPGASRVEFLLEGVTCSACAWLVERVPTAAPDILRADLDLGRSTVKVVFREGTPLASVAQTFRALGFRVRPGDDPELARARARDRRTWALQAGVALACMMASMHVAVSLYAGILEGMDSDMVRELGLALAFVTFPVVSWASIPFYRGAWQSILARRLSLDLLVALAIVAGYATSLVHTFQGINETYYDAVAMLAAFLLTGRLVTRLAEERVKSGGEFLARELAGESSEARPGDRLDVASGETFPGDGIVVSGTGWMNCAWLTGEEEPVALEAGSRVWAGALNVGSSVVVEVERTGRDTRMGQILSLLSGTAKGPLQKLSEKVESWIVAAVLAVVVGLVAWGAWHGHVEASQVVAILLVACPCAVGLAVPAVLGAAHAQAAGKRILLKGADAFERIARIDTVVFDKTGTLTRAIPTLVHESWTDPKLQAGRAPLLAGLAATSAHLVLRPLVSRFGMADPFPDARETPGMGMELQRDGSVWRLGRRAWALREEDRDQPSPTGEWSEVVLSRDGILEAVFGMSASLRPEAPEVVQELSRGREVWILSGDRSAAVGEVARACGVPSERAIAECTPEQKLERVRALSLTGKVLFVGDGVNDAAALRCAHVGVGVQGGAGAALAVCDAYLAEDDLRSLVALFRASDRTRRHILMALLWASCWNLLGVGLVLAGLLGPIVCAVLMPLSSILVVIYALTRRPFGGPLMAHRQRKSP